jgi:hypothetical protein
MNMSDELPVEGCELVCPVIASERQFAERSYPVPSIPCSGLLRFARNYGRLEA